MKDDRLVIKMNMVFVVNKNRMHQGEFYQEKHLISSTQRYLHGILQVQLSYECNKIT